MNVTFIICAAGEGTRFQKHGFQIKKPFLSLLGKTLLHRSLESLPVKKNDQVILLHQFSDNELNFLHSHILNNLKTEIKLIKIEKTTRGQSETALAAEKYIENPRIGIFNIDTYFQCETLDKRIHESQNIHLVPCYKANGDCWSFFLPSSTTSPLKALQATEKQRISDWASVGFYHFNNADHFFALVKAKIAKNPHEELYIAPFYNSLIENGEQVEILNCEKFLPMGTPEQIQEYWNVDIKKLIYENSSSNI